MTNKTAPSSTGTQSPLRRIPNQKRSRERVENILNCAVELIAKSGSDALKMSDLARLSGISIGSLYQYFPDKGAVIQTLAKRYNAQGQDCIKAGLAHVQTSAELCQAFGGLIDEYYALFLAEPVMRDIWSGTQANKALMEMELADSRINARALADAVMRVNPQAPHQDLHPTTFLIMHLGEATLRLAITVERTEGDLLVNTYKRLAQEELNKIASQRPITAC